MLSTEMDRMKGRNKEERKDRVKGLTRYHGKYFVLYPIGTGEPLKAF